MCDKLLSVCTTANALKLFSRQEFTRLKGRKEKTYIIFYPTSAGFIKNVFKIGLKEEELSMQSKYTHIRSVAVGRINVQTFPGKFPAKKKVDSIACLNYKMKKMKKINLIIF